MHRFPLNFSVPSEQMDTLLLDCWFIYAFHYVLIWLFDERWVLWIIEASPGAADWIMQQFICLGHYVVKCASVFNWVPPALSLHNSALNVDGTFSVKWIISYKIKGWNVVHSNSHFMQKEDLSNGKLVCKIWKNIKKKIKPSLVTLFFYGTSFLFFSYHNQTSLLNYDDMDSSTSRLECHLLKIL